MPNSVTFVRIGDYLVYDIDHNNTFSTQDVIIPASEQLSMFKVRL